MLLLTWHGTILRVDQAQNRLSHAPPVPVRGIARDLRVDIQPPLTAATPIGAGMELVPGTRPGTVHLHRNGLYVTINRDTAFPPCDHPEPIETDALLPLADAEAATLRGLLAGAWQHINGQITPTLAPGFKLILDTETIDLIDNRPVSLPDGTVQITGLMRLTPAPAQPPAPEWHLRPAPPGPRCRPVANDAAFHATPDSRLMLSSPAERCTLPMAAHRSDLDWLYRNPQQNPASGLQSFSLELVHEANPWVLLNRSVEGTILTPDGVSNAPGRLYALSTPWPDGLAREAGETFLNTAALRGAPVLEGPHAVFYNTDITGYGHWLLDALVPLCVMQPHLPPETTLLLPATLADSGPFDRLAMLKAFGFDDTAAIMMPAGPCQVQNLYWPNHRGIDQIPATALDAARNRALHRLPPATAQRRRIYIQRPGTRRVTNARAIEHRLKQNGFEFHAMENLSLMEQMDVFRHAECVVGAHGGALANLIFCQPGTKVIELAPDRAYRPCFTAISSKLGLVHAILPCPTSDGTDNGDLRVDGERLAALLRMLLQRL